MRRAVVIETAPSAAACLRRLRIRGRLSIYDLTNVLRHVGKKLTDQILHADVLGLAVVVEQMRCWNHFACEVADVLIRHVHAAQGQSAHARARISAWLARGLAPQRTYFLMRSARDRVRVAARTSLGVNRG